MEMTAKVTPKTAPKGLPVSLILLVLLFATPPMLGWLYFFNPQWLPDKHNNNGELIQPALSLEKYQLTNSSGEIVRSEMMSNAWRMLIFSQSGCEESCQQLLNNIQQIREATGAGRQRILPVLLLLSESSVLPRESHLPADMEVIYSPVSKTTELVNGLGLDTLSSSEQSFVIDPLGAVMMRHDHAVLTQKQILKDMETLLKISQNWVKGAQYGHN